MNTLEQAARLQAERAPDQGAFGIEGILRRIVRKQMEAVPGRLTREDEDDIVQDTYLDLLAHPDNYDPEKASLGTYAGTIAYRKALKRTWKPNLLRDAVSIHGLDPDAEGLDIAAEDDLSPEAQAEVREVRRAILDLFQRLKDLNRTQEREVLKAVIRNDGLRSRAAAELGLTAAAVKRIMQRVKSYEPARRLMKLVDGLIA